MSENAAGESTTPQIIEIVDENDTGKGSPSAEADDYMKPPNFGGTLLQTSDSGSSKNEKANLGLSSNIHGSSKKKSSGVGIPLDEYFNNADVEDVGKLVINPQIHDQRKNDEDQSGEDQESSGDDPSGGEADENNPINDQNEDDDDDEGNHEADEGGGDFDIQNHTPWTNNALRGKRT